MADTRSRASLRNAPPPRDAQAGLWSSGKCTTPATTSPSSSNPINTLHSGLPRTKSRVPSIGSMIQRRPFFDSLRDAFFAQDSVVGKRLFERARDQRSDSRSAVVTGESSGFVSARMPCRLKPQCQRRGRARLPCDATSISFTNRIPWHGSIVPNELPDRVRRPRRDRGEPTRTGPRCSSRSAAGKYRAWTWREYCDTVRQIAVGLRAIGVQEGRHRRAAIGNSRGILSRGSGVMARRRDRRRALHQPSVTRIRRGRCAPPMRAWCSSKT